MVYSNQLQRNTGIVDPLIFSSDIVDSLFHYWGYSTVKNNFKVRKDTVFQTTPTLGSTSEAKLNNIADKIGPIQLIFDLSVPTQTGAAGNPRYVDFVGYFAWSKIELLYATGEIYTLTSEEMLDKYRALYGTEHQSSLAVQVAGDLSQADRETLATAQQRFIVDLPFPHTRGTSRYLEIMQLAQEPRLKVTWRRAEDIVQLGDSTPGNVGTDSAPVATIVNAFLRTLYVHLDGDERDSVTAHTESQDGIIRLFDDYTLQKEDIPAANVAAGGEYRIELRNFRTSTKRINFIVRPKSYISTPGANDYTDLQVAAGGTRGLVDSWFLEGADGKIIEPVEIDYNRYYLHSIYHESLAGEFRGEWNFAWAPDDLLNASGSYNFGNTTNATLVLNLRADADNAVAHEVCIAANEYNTHQHVRGDLLTNFK